MKIAILTLWGATDNYGQVLQCYALKTFLHSLGHEVYAIRYNYERDIPRDSFFVRCLRFFNPIFFIKVLKKRFLKKISDIGLSEKRKFDKFCQENLPQSEYEYSSYIELKNNPPKADVYIVGSDQVWNYSALSLDKWRNQLHAFFLDFGEKGVKRMAYAASWGNKKIPCEYIKEITPLLKKFDYVSVREKTGVKLCEVCGCTTAEWVCDPTMLLTADSYRLLYKTQIIKKPVNKYIFLYMLKNENNFDIQRVFEFAKKRGLEVVYVTANNLIDKRSTLSPTIPEWIYYIDNAEYIITNSFHCGVFASIFHKRFGIISLIGIFEGMNTRFDALFSLYGINERYISTDDFSILDKEYSTREILVSEKFKNLLV